MKLTDLIFEQAGSLRSFMNVQGYMGDYLGPNNTGALDGSTVKELQTQLKRHQLQIGKQAPNPNQIAWVGPVDGKWTQALSDAIIQWKKSINTQMPSARLDATTAELSPRDLNYLVTKKLYTSGSTKGLLYLGSGGDAEPRDYKKFVWSGRTFDVGHQITTPTSSIKNTKDFLMAIGESGWIAILDDFVKQKGVNFYGGDAKNRSEAKALVGLMKTIEAAQNEHPVEWLNRYENDVLKRQGLEMKATLESGNEMHYSPRQAPGYVEIQSVQKGSQTLYEYFKALATGILRKYQTAFNKSQPEVDPETGEEVPPTMDKNKQRAWVVAMNQAIYEGWFEFLPFVGDDEKTIRDLMREVRSAEEYDILSAKYAEMFNIDMNQSLADNLTDENYNSIVVRILLNLQRIRPNLLHGAIPFGEGDSVTVSVDSVSYKVMKKRTDGNKIEVLRGNKNVKNVILQDTILKAAIEQQGGTIPDVISKPSDEFLPKAAEVVIAAVQAEAAFMVPYYVGSDPFDEMINPVMGIQRLKGLQEQAARMLQSGTDEQAIFSFVKNESISDGEWLISTKSVHWDAQWKNVNNNIVGKLDGTLDDIMPSDEQIDLVNRLHKKDTREEAMAEILAEQPIDIFYEEIYRIFPRQHSKHFDEHVLNNETEQIINYVEGTGDFDDPALARIVSEIGIAKAAPAMLAKTFQQSLTRGWWGITNNDEDLAFKLVTMIEDVMDYDLVNEWYKKNGNSSSLIDDLDGSEWAIIGEGKAVEYLKDKLGYNTNIAKADFDPQLANVMSQTSAEPTLENLKKVMGYLERNATGLFATTNDDNEPTGLDPQQVSTFFDFLSKLTENVQKETPEAEMLFDLLDKMVEIVQKTADDLNIDFDNALLMAQNARTIAEKEWFK